VNIWSNHLDAERKPDPRTRIFRMNEHGFESLCVGAFSGIWKFSEGVNVTLLRSVEKILVRCSDTIYRVDTRSFLSAMAPSSWAAQNGERIARYTTFENGAYRGFHWALTCEPDKPLWSSDRESQLFGFVPTASVAHKSTCLRKAAGILQENTQ